MPSKPFDPLTFIPSPDAIQQHIDHVDSLSRRLRILLSVSTKIHQTGSVRKRPSRRELKNPAINPQEVISNVVA